MECLRYHRLLVFSGRILFIFMFAANDSIAERQITTALHGHVLTNHAVWSPDGEWIVYDIRSDPAGDNFDGARIERVHVESGRTEVMYQTTNGAHCGVATYHPHQERVVFIHGPENPDAKWKYQADHRRGVTVDIARPGMPENLDARDIVPPYTAGALRGGSHVHTFSGDGKWVAFTYEDHVLSTSTLAGSDLNQRNVGISVPLRETKVPRTHPRNHNGSHFSVVVTQTSNAPRPGSDEISRAFSDAWIGTSGYLRSDGTHQQKAIAFQGLVQSTSGASAAEVFVVDIPYDVSRASATGPLQGTAMHRPTPPHGAVQRRLTFTTEAKYPGIQGVRHWLRSSPDGSQIAFLRKNDRGISQLWTISPNGGKTRQVTSNDHDIASAFSWSSDGKHIAHIMDQSVCVTTIANGRTRRLTARDTANPLRPEACVFSPDGARIAYVRQVSSNEQPWNQIFVTEN